nr:MAG TPA: hypothetical protein [Caudoviricetes sp.]
MKRVARPRRKLTKRAKNANRRRGSCVATAGDRRKSPAFFGINNHLYMQSYIKELKEKGLVPLRLDNNTVLFVPPEKANEKYKARYLKNAERSRRMATHLD